MSLPLRAMAFSVPVLLTGVTYTGTLDAARDAEFVIGEERGALMLVSVNAAAGDPKMAVYRADTGASLPDEHPNNVAHSDHTARPMTEQHGR